jgi:hypothetical protein
LSASVNNKEEAKRKVDVIVKVKLEDPSTRAALKTANGQQNEIELKELENKVLDIVLDSPFQIKDVMQTVWEVTIVEKIR